MKKRLICLVLTAALLLCLAPAAAAEGVVRSPQTVFVDGAETVFDIYNIDGMNYFRLRDLALALSGTQAEFSVGYEAEFNIVFVLTGGVYEPAGGELTLGEDLSATAVKSAQSVLINGETAALAPYNIGGMNYFRLRELAPFLGFGVEYDAAADAVLILSAPPETVSVHFIDVGQGDCTFIDAGEFEILIDAGTAAYGEIVSTYISDYVDGPLDLIIATHAHADHIGGLARVIADYEVLKIIDSGSVAETKSWTDYNAAALNEAGCEIIYDCDMVIDAPCGAQIEILEILDGDKNENNNSVIAVFRYGVFSVLLTGDAEAEAEELIATRIDEVTVFKAAHHGSRTANTLPLLEAASPQLVVISCGYRNTYGHPHEEALASIAAVGAPYMTTQLAGNIVFTSDGADFNFKTDLIMPEAA